MTNRRAVLAFGILGGIALAALAVVGPFGGVLARSPSISTPRTARVSA